MNIESAAAIAEIVSSLAILVTLIYLAKQTQQTNNALLANSRQAMMTAEVALIASVINSPDAYANSERPFSELTPAERYQVGNMLAGLLRVREYAWFQYKHGILDEATLRSYLAPVARWINSGEVSYFWQMFAAEIDPEFVSYVEKLVDLARANDSAGAPGD